MYAVERGVYFRDDLCASCAFYWSNCWLNNCSECPTYHGDVHKCGCLLSAAVSEMEQNICSHYKPFNFPTAGGSGGESEQIQ